MIKDAGTLMAQMEAQVTGLQMRIAALDQQTEQNTLDIIKNGRQPLIQPKSQPETFLLNTPQKSAAIESVGPPRGIQGPQAAVVGPAAARSTKELL